MDQVSIASCPTYEIETVREAVKNAVSLIGGMENFVSPGDKVLLKVNLLLPRHPDKVTTTHPAVAQAVAELVLAAGGIPIIGDSPGGTHFYTAKTLVNVYKVCGMKEAAERSGATLNENTEVVDVSYHEGVKLKSVKTIKAVLDVDKIINIPKVKTHMMAVFSGAVKNMFGIVPGSYKADYHLRYENLGDFADVLIDLHEFRRPVLNVMDAVIGMEGYGPTNGNPRPIGLVIASPNAYALDAVATHIIGLKPEQVPTVVKAHERGLGPKSYETVEVIGEELETVRVIDFRKPTIAVSFNIYNIFLPKFISRRLSHGLRPYPKFKTEVCKRCAVCAKSCPPKAIVMKNGMPKVDLDKCIRCFCCHELCEFDAIAIARPWWLKLFLK